MTDANASARDRILARLKSAPKRPAPPRPDWTPPAFGSERKARFKAMLEASHAEVHEVTDESWPERLLSILGNKGARTLLYAPATEAGRRLSDAWSDGGPALLAYDRSVEDLKEVLVHQADAALTTARGGIAQTGSLVLWPTPDEPRLMSLLPPIHVALVNEADLTDSLAETIRAQGWATAMPTNALLVSGPSKTADIEQTLAYGVHGPKELVVLLVGPEGARP
ncbi:lactate utilization protein B/C [Paramagnetospirillum marisnigri]|uniref:Lactate utilization protein B/C n=1 Tax=Paramagnetospirillum marisnigri TaxID=1285242 RepID=A0A178MXG2_9PROT|nr:lactate utilization protein [Paramagnetospirillum marisnigri]OAN55972.1 lactate utilization protein B/C [Paramagnetospirillum marisnigri]